MNSGSYIPCDILKPYVASFAIYGTSEMQTYKVLPGTGLVMGFQYKGNLATFNGEKETPLSASGITGLDDAYRVFKNTADTGTVLVYFKEAGAAPFFKEPLHELFRESLSLDNFMLRSELLILEEKLCEAKSGAEKIKVVESFLLARMGDAKPDQLVLAALSLIHKSKGNIRMKDLAAQLHTSISPMEKRFRKSVGASPKKFAAVVRLKNVILQYKPGSPLTEAAYEAGFYDQAHFIKEFKIFTGETPQNYFSAGQ